MTKQNKTTSTTLTTVKTETVLTDLEENVVRMRLGLKAPETMVLEQKHHGDPELAQRLADMEKQTLAAAGARNTSAKRRIVSALRRVR